MNFSYEIGLLLSMNFTNMKLWLTFTGCVLFSQTLLANPSNQPFKAFPDTTLSDWKEKSLAGHTKYKLIKEGNSTVLQADANSTASLLFKEEAIDLTTNPWLEWSWKIDSIYKGIDEKTKGGDDYPARLYVVAKVGLLPWDSLAINYVWSSNQPINSNWKSPFTSKSTMVSVQSGEQNQGTWVSQRRNVAHDFKQYFNVDVKQIRGYAVMVDGDNASQSGTAYFGNIDFLSN